MRAIIGARFLASKEAQPREKPFEIRDMRLPGFILRVQPSGVRSYIAQVARNRRVTLAKVGQMTPDQARERCEKILGNVAHGRDPLTGIDGTDKQTFGEFLDGTYDPWLRVNRSKSAARTLQRIETCFASWRAKPLQTIDVALIEGWKTDRLKDGRAPATVLRDTMTLSGILSRAEKLGRITLNPVRRIDKPRIDRLPKVRFLGVEEETRLRAALDERDAEMRAARVSANEWRRARRVSALPALEKFGDHLAPAVLVSMNTGIRRGELLALKWDAIDLRAATLTIEGSTSKSTQTRHVPLNAEALTTLKQWRDQSEDRDRVFPVDTGFKTAFSALLARSKIARFRWHDLRHHFASRLAQAGVPLNTIRELLGHQSLAMTLRYAHLSPDQKRNAVALLNSQAAA
jgi:integrase